MRVGEMGDNYHALTWLATGRGRRLLDILTLHLQVLRVVRQVRNHSQTSDLTGNVLKQEN